jgi:hypothetical protein
MIIDVTELSIDEIQNILSKNYYEIATYPPPGTVPWQLRKKDNDANTPVATVIYSGTIDRTFEVTLVSGNKPIFLSYKKQDGKFVKFIMFPAPATMTASSTHIQIELIYEGTASGYSMLKCPI